MLLANKTFLMKPKSVDIRHNSIEGSYTTKETRMEQKRAFSGASFWLGANQSKLCNRILEDNCR